MTFDFHPEAEAEFEEAVAFYEDHAVGLGLDFAAEGELGSDPVSRGVPL